MTNHSSIDSDNDPLMKPAEVAAVLGVREQSLATMRMRGTGPAYFKLGEGQFARVRYKRSDVNAYIKRIRPVSEVA